MTRFTIASFIFVSLSSIAFAENRTFDGQGNNLSNSDWGAAGTAFRRIDQVRYGDMISSPSGVSRPNARDVSNSISQQTATMPDVAGRSAMVWQWGQFLDHDFALTPKGTEFLPVMVSSPGDPLFPMIPMMRSEAAPGTGTGMGNPRQQLNNNTSYIDASMIYGSSQARADALRTFNGGQLKTSAAGRMLPRNTSLLPNDNDGVEPAETLFLAGDVRSNEQVGLTSIHTLFVREHNRLATRIANDNPNWTDEQVYHRTRKLVGGMVQQITYNEYLPALMGAAAPDLQTASYDSTRDASLSNEFATVAFRLGHTQVNASINRRANDGSVAPGGAVDLANTFFSPSHFDAGADEVDYLLHGLALQVQEATDVRMIDTLRNALFGAPGSGGMDLLSLNLQRSRDHGLGTITQLQSALGLPEAQTFGDLTSDTQLLAQLESVYSDVSEVDMWIGLLSEDRLADSAVGATLSEVLAQQFRDTMEGDRFFYLWDDALTQAEFDEISQTTFSDILLRNTGIDSLPSNVFFVPEPSAMCLLVLAGLFRFLARKAN